MATCAYCRSTILFGGKRQDDMRFCSEDCHRNGFLAVAAQELPDGEVEDRLMQIHLGPCPQCQGPGPNEVYVSHHIWSAIVTTSYSSKLRISCRGCGFRRQLGATVQSLLFGWWGIPWGLIMTPVQLGRNIVGMANPPDDVRPSDRLRLEVGMQIAAERYSYESTVVPEV